MVLKLILGLEIENQSENWNVFQIRKKIEKGEKNWIGTIKLRELKNGLIWNKPLCSFPHSLENTEFGFTPQKGDV